MNDFTPPKLAPSGAIEHFVNSRLQNKMAFVIAHATANLEKWDRDDVIDRTAAFIAKRNGKPATPFLNRIDKLLQGRLTTGV